MDEVRVFHRHPAIPLRLYPIAAVVFAAPFLALHFFFDLPLSDLVEYINNDASLIERVSMPLLILGGIISIWVDQRFASEGRLILDATGIRLKSGLPAPFKPLLERNWPLLWNEIDHARLMANPGNQTRVLLIITSVDGKKRRLALSQWQPRRSTAAPPSLFSGRKTWSDLDMLRYESKLAQALTKAGVRIEIGNAGLPLPGSNLTQHPQAIFAMMTLAVAGAYGLADGFIVQPYQLIPPHPWIWWAAIGAMGGAIFWALLAQSRLQRIESFSLALLVGGAFALAAYPGAMRANALTAEPKTLTFTLGQSALSSNNGDTQLHIPIEGDFWRDPATPLYWELKVYQGALGFYQYDPTPVIEARKKYLQRGSS